MMETSQKPRKWIWWFVYCWIFKKYFIIRWYNDDNDTDSDNIEEIEEIVRGYHTTQIDDDN